MIKKADIFLFIFLILAGLGLSFLSVAGSVTGSQAVVSVDGKLYGSYSLSKDQVITINENNHINKITIKGGQVSMTFSDCHNQICVKHSEITKTSESIVCLPNKVMVEIKGKGGDFDAISN
ncbi:MAG: NusG domain II-containing protein [Anaerovoracaceae bacterium]